MRAGQVPWITSGTGKSHLVEALAHAAIEKDLRVAWFTLEWIGRAENLVIAGPSVISGT